MRGDEPYLTFIHHHNQEENKEFSMLYRLDLLPAAQKERRTG